LIQEGSEVR